MVYHGTEGQAKNPKIDALLDVNLNDNRDAPTLTLTKPHEPVVTSSPK